VWAGLDLSRDQIDVSVTKRGVGVYIRYGYHALLALDMANFPERIRAELPYDLVVTFGT
jgi:hypothetical protein